MMKRGLLQKVVVDDQRNSDSSHCTSARGDVPGFKKMIIIDSIPWNGSQRLVLRRTDTTCESVSVVKPKAF